MSENNEMRPYVEGTAVGLTAEIVGDGREEFYRNANSRMLTTLSARDLIRLAKEHPPEAIIEGLLNVGDTLLLHGTEESFKSIFALQIAESIAMGRPLLRRWNVTSQRRVGVVETEMHPASLGERLAKMFSEGAAPENIRFLGDEVLNGWRREGMEGKFQIIGKWIADEEIEVLVVDTVNDFFRGNNNPSAETVAGDFFDRLRNLHLGGCVIVRHDHKHRDEDSGAHSNERIRGSAEFKEDPEAIVFLQRLDKRTSAVEVEVGKLRYGRKPDSIQAWLDAGCFRLTPLPPIIACLEGGRKCRRQLIAECEARFGMAQRTTDDMLAAHRAFLREEQDGHNRVVEIDPERGMEAPWSDFLTHA
jgi:hypothetical protein